jgi:multiple sugar transport system ATP-binding protein
MELVQFKNISKGFGSRISAVDRLSLTVYEKELICLLGPSGCGKTTTFMLLAGLETPDNGELYIGDTLVSQTGKIIVASYHRNIGMVFQNSALWPHMTVRQHLEFVLRSQHLTKQGREVQIHKIASLTQIAALMNSYPGTLSGGEVQRVALARALVRQPKILLFDEPLSNLDAELKKRLRTEIVRFHKELGLTTIYVTHDQEEALQMSDRIALMNHGQIVQLDKPEEIYYRPSNSFVASFIGEGAILTATIKENRQVISPIGVLPYDSVDLRNTRQVGEVKILIRPENVRISVEGAYQGQIKSVRFNGDRWLIGIETTGCFIYAYSDKALKIDEFITWQIVKTVWGLSV